LLGIGTGERESNVPYGVDWSKPVARFEEAVATIRSLWDSNGELVTRGLTVLPVAQSDVRPAPVQGQVAPDLADD
jgi:phthiodiolone/phenolphthiodiolone dimycocerosates ketoreductase